VTLQNDTIGLSPPVEEPDDRNRLRSSERSRRDAKD